MGKKHSISISVERKEERNLRALGKSSLRSDVRADDDESHFQLYKHRREKQRVAEEEWNSQGGLFVRSEGLKDYENQERYVVHYV